MKTLFSFFSVAVLGLVAVNTMFALNPSVCPVFIGGSAGGVNVSAAYTTAANAAAANGGCNVLITFLANGTIMTTFPNSAVSYDDGLDDNMVGVINLSNVPITNLTLMANTAPFSFDGDGACDPTWIFANQAPGPNPCGITTSGYGHQGVTFSGITNGGNTGTVNFATAIGLNGSNWFSLEGPVALNLIVIPNVPEPASVLLFGTVLAGVAFKIRRKQARRT